MELLNPLSMEYTFFISAFIGMSTEIVALSLDQVSWQDCRAIAVVVGNGSRECWNRDTVLNSISHDITQCLLIFISNLFEVVIIKTKLTKPYTSTFFELDCKYWDSNKQTILNERIANTGTNQL